MKEKHEKSENRRALPKFLLTLAGAAVAGVVIGFFTGVGANLALGERLAAGLEALMRIVALWGIPVTAAVTMGGALLLYLSARRQYQGWDGEAEDPMDRAEVTLSWAMLLSGLQMALSMFFFAAAVQYRQEGTLIAVAELLVSVGLVIFVQQKCVDLTKRMNPEKQGSVYDTKFHRKWMDSCDEAERQQVGQAALRAFRAAGSACTWIWMVLMVLGFLFDIGLLPVLVVLLLWCILQVSYVLECIRLSKGGGQGA